jgi:hypothetical protein
MRVAQGEVAEAAGITSEEISPAKFYPKLAAAGHSYVVTQLTVHDIRRLNPPDACACLERRREHRAPAASPPLGAIGSPSLTSAVAANSSGYLCGGAS